MKKILILALAFALGWPQTPVARADTPAIYVALAVVFIGGSAAALYIQESGRTSTETTETEEGGEETTTTTEGGSEEENSAPSSGNVPPSMTFTTLTNVNNWFQQDESETRRRNNRVKFERLTNKADILLSRPSVQQVHFVRRRTVTYDIRRRPGALDKPAVVPLTFSANELGVSTTDVAGTDGAASMVITFRKNDKELFRYTAAVNQNELPVATGDIDFDTIQLEPNVLKLTKARKSINVPMSLNQTQMRVEVTIEMEGRGTRL